MKTEGEYGDGAIAKPLLVDNGHYTVEPPYYRDSIPGSTSFFKTCFNCLNALSGIGILSITYALSSGGWLSLILFFLIAGCTFYTGLLIKKCMDMDPNIQIYPDIGYQAFGAKGRTLLFIAMNVELFLVAAGYLILEGDNIQSLFPNMEFEINGLVISGKQSVIVIVGLIMLPLVWLDNMSILAYISASGVIASFILIFSLFWAGAFDGIGFHEKGTFLNWTGIPTALSLYAFCYCAHPVFPPLYTSMRNPKKFSKVLQICFLICTMSYAAMAILGYCMFGSMAESQITLNLPNNKISSKVAISTTLVNPLAKYAIAVTPIVSALEKSLLSHPNKGLSTFIRTCLVIGTIIVALAVPFFGSLLSLVGAFFNMTASVILPCLCYLKISGTYRRFGLTSISVWSIVLIGLLVLVVGTYTALQEIFEHLIT